MKIKSFLLLGPTGAGKTPLGDILEERGLYDYQFFHFDFGAELRKIASGENLVEDNLRELVKSILSEGRLLREEEYFIFKECVGGFMGRRVFKSNAILLLNGFPRDLKQALFAEKIVDVKGILYLSSTPETILERLWKDPAGDRKGRDDDTPELIAKKLAWFKERTLPLITFFQKKGTKIVEIEVESSDDGESLYQKLLLKGKDFL